MAKIIKNDKGFKILGLTIDECKSVGFGAYNGITHVVLCDDCNTLLIQEPEVYYVAVLNRIFCAPCLLDWYNNANYYPEDSRYEALKYDTVINYLEVDNGEIDILTLAEDMQR